MLKENKAQEEAIHTVEGQMVLIACPGSGKTTTLIRRIHYMVEEKKISPEHILMITFTKAAATEMKKRYADMYGSNPGVTFSTIHAFCLAIIRKFVKGESLSILTDYEARNFLYNRIRYNRTINDKDAFVNDILLDFTRMKNCMISLSDYKQKATKDRELFEKVYTAYEDYKTEEHKIDFDDMMILAKDIMENNPECLNWLRDRYQYIQVDEYQDTNLLQRDIIYLLAGENGNLTVVGDDDQSIYAFRGAKPDIMLDFPKDYPDAKQIFMDTNYRSGKAIIGQADKLIRQNSVRFPKKFNPFRTLEGNIEQVAYKTRADEMEKMTKKIQNMIKLGEDPNDIAILYRANYQSMEIAEHFFNEKIPFHSNEKIPSKYQHWIYHDILAYHRLAEGDGTDADLNQVINHPNRFLFGKGITENGLDKDKMLLAVMTDPKKQDWQIDKAVEAVQKFFFGLDRMKGKDPKKSMDILENLIKYKKYILDYCELRNQDEEEALSVWKSLYDDCKKCSTWEKWQQSAYRYDQELNENMQKQEGITLSTMHRAKGLEWKHVFLIDCIDGICPFEKAVTPEEIEEERRLFYVAETRAKEFLYLYSYKRKESGGKAESLSPFL